MLITRSSQKQKRCKIYMQGSTVIKEEIAFLEWGRLKFEGGDKYSAATLDV